MRRFWRCCLALALFTSYDFNCLRGVNATSSPLSATYSTCATGSVNWITQTLPQQCLKTSRAAPNTSVYSDDIASSALPEGDRLANRTVDSLPPANETLAGAKPVPNAQNSITEGSQTVQLTGRAESFGLSDAHDAQRPARTEDAATLAETEADSALQSANFLSFEDWKKQKLGDAAQSAEELARLHHPGNAGGERQRPGAALDTLGEDSEIDLDFTGFGAGTTRQGVSTEQYGVSSAGSDPNASPSSGPSSVRSKDAGRTCKERFNYASFDCAANVLKTNSRCKSSSSVLVENKDSYMLNECSMDNKFLIVELCEYIQIDTVVLANFEFFSSMFRTFRVSVSDRYPVKIDKWQVLGVYEARNTREIQAFLVDNPLIWAKYIRIEFLTHYGNEYYCPLSLLRVHGTTMMEDYRHQEELASGQFDASDEEIQVENEAIAIPAVSSKVRDIEDVITPLSPEEALKPELIPSAVDSSQDAGAPQTTPSVTHLPSSSAVSIPDYNTSSWKSVNDSDATVLSKQINPVTTSGSPSPSSADTPSQDWEHDSDARNTVGLAISTDLKSTSSGLWHAASSSTKTPNPASSTLAAATTVSNRPETNNLPTPSPEARANATDTLRQDRSASVNKIGQGPASTDPSTTYQQAAMPMTTHSSNRSSTAANANISSSTNQVASAVPTSTQPATQESFFKTLSKRLSLLEANATLSLQYIESQSMLLRDAFTAVEKRQIAKTASFLATLNETVLKELSAARLDYDQLWQSTVLELAHYREEGRHEREVLNEQVRLLAEEVVGQRRLMAVQVTVVLIVLGLFLFTKAAPGHTNDTTSSLGMGDIRILQGMQALMARGRSSKRPRHPASAAIDDENQRATDSTHQYAWDSPPASSPGATRPATSHGMDESHEDAWNDLLAFVDENVRPRQRGQNNGPAQYLRQKPLPPAPRPDLIEQNSGTSESEDVKDSPTADTPMSIQYVEDEEDARTNYRDETRVQNRGLLGVAGRIAAERRAISIRGAKSAPTTPQVESLPIFDNAENLVADSPAGGSGASDTGSIGLGIEVDGT